MRGSGSAAAWAEDTPGAAAPAVAERADLGPVPTDWGLSQNDYYADAAKVRTRMKGASLRDAWPKNTLTTIFLLLLLTDCL